jgi:choline dehydrogenase-like flavoprotein
MPMIYTDRIPTKDYATIVVGAGSSGAVVAARLSEAGNEVLLLEAGAVFASMEAVPEEVRDPSNMSASFPGHAFNWDLISHLTDAVTMPIPRGKVMGGSSSVNGAYFVRGTEADFEHWHHLGNDLWSWDKVLPAFVRSERDLDYNDRWHGTDGPVPVHRLGRSRAPEFYDAFVAACLGLGFADEPDKNAGGSGGVGPVPFNIDGTTRMGTALAYLLPACARPNLTVCGNVYVRCVVIEHGRAIGVEVSVNGEIEVLRADRVVLSAGAYRSPQLLMLSGVGPADDLAAMGIDVLIDAPGVGRNLVDHPELMASYDVACELPDMPGSPVMPAALNWQSNGRTGSRGTDLEILTMVRKMGATLNPLGAARRPFKTLAAMRGTSIRVLRRQLVAQGKPYLVMGVMQEGSRGSVTLASSDPLTRPIIRHRFLDAQTDRERFREICIILDQIYGSPEMKEIGGEVLGLADAVRAGHRGIDEWVIDHLFVAGHAACTCKMGPDSDAMAVVDQYTRVRGVESLYVVDTSSFPHIPSRGPNATAIMFGERAAEMISADL